MCPKLGRSNGSKGRNRKKTTNQTMKIATLHQSSGLVINCPLMALAIRLSLLQPGRNLSSPECLSRLSQLGLSLGRIASSNRKRQAWQIDQRYTVASNGSIGVKGETTLVRCDAR